MEKYVESCILESRISLSRNLKDLPFPVAMENDEVLVEKLKWALAKDKIENTYHLSWREGQTIDAGEQVMLLRKRGISSEMLSRARFHIIEDKKNSVFILVGGIDHLLIQMRNRGLQLKTIWRDLSKFDDILEGELNFAFDSELGYLTSKVTDVGTGLHASILMHLPALVDIGYIDRVFQAAAQLGLTITGLSGKARSESGHLFRVENHMTIGRSEEEILETLMEVSRQIVIKEHDALETLLSSRKTEIEDRVFRALGALQYARIMGYDEALGYLSDVRLGIGSGMIKNIELEALDTLFYKLDNSVMQGETRRILNALDLGKMRADKCRLFIKQYN